MNGQAFGELHQELYIPYSTERFAQNKSVMMDDVRRVNERTSQPHLYCASMDIQTVSFSGLSRKVLSPP